MHCKHANQMMSERLDGRLDGAASAALDAHLGICDACRAEWRHMQALDRLLGAAPMVEPPVRMRVRVMTRLSRRDQARRALVGGTTLTLGTITLALLVAAPLLISLAGTTGIAPAVLSGGPATLAQVLTTVRAAGRALLVVLGQFAVPLAALVAGSIVAAVALNGAWIRALRHLRNTR